VHVALFLPLLLVSTLAAPQVPPRDQQAKPRAGTGTIRGRVVRADTGEPLRRVEVRVDEWSTPNEPGEPAATLTDADGRYVLPQLPAGRYQLRASRGGYVDVAYGQRRPFERGRPLELGEGVTLHNIDFALPPGAVVTGRVLDELGEPVPRVSVSLVRRRYVEGGRRLVYESGSSTDDRGEFRIFGVAPGDYAIVATFNAGGRGGRDRLRYVPTYYPGTPVANHAERVTIGPGQEVAGITIPLARAAAATVRGVVRRSDNGSFGPFTFVTAREIGGEQPSHHTGTALAGADGSFALTGLLPGTYLLEARATSGTEYASTEVVVDGPDLSGVTLLASRGATGRGRIRFDTGDLPPGLRPSEIFVAATSAVDTELDIMRGGPPMVRDDWTFELQGLRGRGFIRAGTLGDWQMKRVRREGVDVTDTPLPFTTDIDDLEIELTQRLTTVSGGVSDGRGGQALDATVIVFADDPTKWGRHSRFIGAGRPDQTGRFTIRGLPPGRYLAVAIDYLEPGEERDPDLLEAWRQAGKPFTLAEGETLMLDLNLSPL
jgi:protocatechuate 3,4-dioxygenase beta subunit